MMLPRAIRRAAALCSVAAALAAAGCGDTNLPDAAVGNYLLLTVNAQGLPFTLPGTPVGVTVRLEEGRLTINSGGTFEQVFVFRTTTADPNDVDPGLTVSQTLGDVEVSGSTIRFRPRFETEFNGQLTSDGLTYTRGAGAQSFVFAFDKQ